MTLTQNKNSVCAVVVTYNRKNLLLECLEALRKQTRPIQAIYIIDNASSDGTPKLLLEKGYIQELPPKDLNKPWEKVFEIKNLINGESIKIYYVRMHENTGGAGGFHEGIKRAYEKGYDWLWLMDDDTIANENSLKVLLNKVNFLKYKENLGFLCSKVLWIDQKPHLMNIPGIKSIINNKPFNLYDKNNLLIVETASFVSLLIPRKVVEKVGLPCREFFIWADDTEYTLRITKNNFLGFYVKDSYVLHKTKRNYSAHEIYDWRFFYKIRNNLWIYRMYYKKKFLLKIIYQFIKTFKLPFTVWLLNVKAIVASIVSRPKFHRYEEKDEY